MEGGTEQLLSRWYGTDLTKQSRPVDAHDHTSKHQLDHVQEAVPPMPVMGQHAACYIQIGHPAALMSHTLLDTVPHETRRGCTATEFT